uniref:Uncharacterized protein n=1 Tax=Cucumis sativus TaxID=3659 RepID=A0A0A0KG89_CUCSA
MNFLELQTAVVVMTPIESTFSLDVNSNLGNIKVMINLFLVKPCFPVDLLIMMMRISSEKVSLFKYLSCVELGQYQEQVVVVGLGKPLKKSLHEVIVVSQSIMRTQRIFGLLQVKSLLTVTAEAETPVGAVSIRRIHRVPSDIPLYDILNVFQKGNNHMVVVVKVKEKTKNSALSSNGEKHGEKSFTSGISPLVTPLLTKH